MKKLLHVKDKVKRNLDKTHHILNNPFDFLLNIIVRAIVYLFIPIPLVAELIVEFKGIIISILLNAVLVIAVLILLLINTFTNQHANASSNITIPADGSFISTDIPAQNPLGGQGLSLVKITAGFMDPSYTFFGGVHTGVDFVPDDLYYQTNKTYKDTGDVVVYSTLNGTVNYYVDNYGSHTVEVTNPEDSVKTVDRHLNKVFVNSGQSITAGTPVGTMGDTGFSTGEHLHYEIRLNEDGTWIPVNPLDYIH